MLAAGLIWALLGSIYAAHGQTAALEAAAKHVILDYGVDVIPRRGYHVCEHDAGAARLAER